jgi:hypothetical protein
LESRKEVKLISRVFLSGVYTVDVGLAISLSDAILKYKSPSKIAIASGKYLLFSSPAYTIL